MRSSITLDIPEPCHEDWDQMTPAAHGRHCAACQKTVVDFSLMTDGEILAYLAKRSGNLCGRFADSQLQRPLQPLVLKPVSSWRRWLAAALTAWTLREGAALAASAKPPTRHSHTSPAKPVPRRRLSAHRSKPIRGVVRDDFTGNVLPDAAVFLKGENRSAMTDSAGRFRLLPPAKAGAPARHTLVVHLAGYKSRTVTLPVAGPAAATVEIVLSRDPGADGIEVVAQGLPRERQWHTSGSVSQISVEYVTVKPSFFQRLLRLFHRRPATS